jgi:acetyl esterase/lipase
MSTKHLLDPELISLADEAFDIPITAEMLPKFRAARDKALVLGDAEAANVTREEVHIASETGPDLRCVLYIPNAEATSRPGYLHIHGGGYIMGEPEMSDIMNILIAKKLGVVVCSVDYRLAPEHPIPAPLDDCYDALAWFHNNADSWNVDRSRIAIGGESAGGGLAAMLAIHARDKGEYPICHQHLTYPMLDNLTGTEEKPGDPLTGEFIWTRARNIFGWESFLGDAPAVAPQVPSRVEDYSNLPNTWIFTASLDLFRDENIDYAQSLLKAGVSTELVVLAGACHGFQMIPGTKIGKRYLDDHLKALGKALGV